MSLARTRCRRSRRWLSVMVVRWSLNLVLLCCSEFWARHSSCGSIGVRRKLMFASFASSSAGLFSVDARSGTGIESIWRRADKYDEWSASESCCKSCRQHLHNREQFDSAGLEESTYRRLAPASGRVQRSYGVVSGRSPSERRLWPNLLGGGISRSSERSVRISADNACCHANGWAGDRVRFWRVGDAHHHHHGRASGRLDAVWRCGCRPEFAVRASFLGRLQFFNWNRFIHTSIFCLCLLKAHWS